MLMQHYHNEMGWDGEKWGVGGLKVWGETRLVENAATLKDQMVQLGNSND